MKRSIWVLPMIGVAFYLFACGNQFKSSNKKSQVSSAQGEARMVGILLTANDVPAGCTLHPLLDFETLPDGTVPTDNTAVTDLYQQSHGISLSLEWGREPKMVKKGVCAQWYGNGYGAWCGFIRGFQGVNSGINRWNTPRAGQGVGEFYLVDDQVQNRYSINPISVTYSTPAISVSGVILDLDGEEQVSVQARDNRGVVIDQRTLAAQYRVSELVTGDGVATQFRMDRSVPEIDSIRISSNMKSGFGFALDNLQYISCP